MQKEMASLMATNTNASNQDTMAQMNSPSHEEELKKLAESLCKEFKKSVGDNQKSLQK